MFGGGGSGADIQCNLSKPPVKVATTAVTAATPASPLAFGVMSFVVFVALLYLVLRLDRD